jgi:predicted metal-dependent enzyme (double-stranded beta helix superfamily)
MSLSTLVEEIRQTDKPREIASVLERYLTRHDLLTPEQAEPDPNTYRQHILHVEPDGSFSVTAVVWLPGQETCIHDHISWCVVGTHEGTEEETRYRFEGGVLTLDGVSQNPAGTAVYLDPPGDIHSVRNSSGTKVISIHIYGADIAALGSSIRRKYELPVGAR